MDMSDRGIHDVCGFLVSHCCAGYYEMLFHWSFLGVSATEHLNCSCTGLERAAMVWLSGNALVSINVVASRRGSTLMGDHWWEGKRSRYVTSHLQCESKKISPYGFLKFFPKRLGIFNQFFTHLLHHHFYTRLQIFIQISPTLTKLCHTKRDHLAKYYISLEL